MIGAETAWIVCRFVHDSALVFLWGASAYGAWLPYGLGMASGLQSRREVMSLAAGQRNCRIEIDGNRSYQVCNALVAGDGLKRRMNQIEQWTVRTLCALALLFVGFAHQVPAVAGDDLGPAQLANYVLPDGTLPTLCVTVTDDSGKAHGKIAHLHGCEACRISASVVLPPPDVAGRHVGFVMAVEMPRRSEAFHRQLFPPNTGPRAPPSNPIPA